jgi:catechol 2,3-dioxygenase-like lactoylglutathione lyase family enzyme
MPTIRGLSHVVLYVNDLEKMVAFYQDVLGLVKYREHAWRVDTPTDVKEFYERFKAQGVPIDHCVSHAYEEMGNTVSCYFLDPEGNRLEIYALVAERDNARVNRPLDLDKSVNEIVAQASGLSAGSH